MERSELEEVLETFRELQDDELNRDHVQFFSDTPYEEAAVVKALADYAVDNIRD